MQYTYTNVTQQIQTCFLASKDQNSVSTRTFVPGASLTLDYPGLNMYVPQYLSRTEIDIDFNIPSAAPVVAPIQVIEPIAEVVVEDESELTPIEPIIEEPQVVIIEPVVVEPVVVEPVVAESVSTEIKVKIAKPKPTKKAKK